MTSLVKSVENAPALVRARHPGRPLAQTHDVQTGELFRILWLRRFWIAALTAALVLAAVLYSLLTPWLYTASAQILIDPRDKVVVVNDVNPSTMAPDGGVAQVESQARVIESTSVLLRAIKTTGLAQDPEFAAPGLFARLFGNTAAQKTAAESPGDIDPATSRTLTALRKRLAIKRADKVFVIEITVTAKSPGKAARIANAIAQAYLDDSAAARTGSAVDASDALAARLSEQKQKVNDAENAVETYKADHGIVSAANGILVGDQQLTDITTQMETARSKTAELRARLAQIEGAHGSSVQNDATAEALASSVMTQLRARDAQLVQREAELKIQLGARHPDIAAIQSQRRDVKSLINGELDRIRRSARADVDRAQANEAALAKRLDRLTSDSLAAKQASVRLRELERDLEASRTVYASFLLRTEQTREQSGIDSSNARIITQAIPPQDHSWPLIGFLVLGALGGGIGLGAAGAFAREYVSPTVLSAAQLQQVFDLPVIPVPLAPTKSRWFGRNAATPAVDIPPSLDDVALDAVLRRLFGGSSAKRAVDRVYSILLVAGRGDEARATELARHLAGAAEAIGERVLLVDASPRDMSDTTVPGLLDVLRGDCSLDMVVKPRPNSRVMMLNPGHHRQGSADWRRAQNAVRLFQAASRRFDIMIINGGVAADNARLSVMTAEVDEIFIVAESGKSLQRDVIGAADALVGMDSYPSGAMLVETKKGA